jgi:succinate dehydrogenase / fumarate reductase flavoprotein subunit
VTHLPQATHQKLESVLEIYEKFTGEDPRKVPMRIFPAVHYSMGGGWVDWPAADDKDRWSRYRHMTNLEGCFNIGESDYQYHGANRLGANSLLSCIYSGLLAGCEIPRYLENLTTGHQECKGLIFDEALSREVGLKKDLFSRNGRENVFKLHEEMSDYLVSHVTVKRSNKELANTIEFIKEIRERYKNISLADHGSILNQTYIFANQFKYMIELALTMSKGALLRDEFRGSHYKPEFPNRDDEKFLKKTIATYSKEEPIISYEPVDTRHLKPIKRDYSKAGKVQAHLENIPDNIKLPI